MGLNPEWTQPQMDSTPKVQSIRGWVFLGSVILGSVVLGSVVLGLVGE